MSPHVGGKRSPSGMTLSAPATTHHRSQCFPISSAFEGSARSRSQSERALLSSNPYSSRPRDGHRLIATASAVRTVRV
jgi:hypothetical protein